MLLEFAVIFRIKIEDAPIFQGKVSEQSKHKQVKFRSQRPLIYLSLEDSSYPLP